MAEKVLFTMRSAMYIQDAKLVAETGKLYQGADGKTDCACASGIFPEKRWTP